MDQSRAPVIEAIDAYRRSGHLSFLPPGHKQGRGVDPRTVAALGRDAFASDIILMNGLDDRAMRHHVLADAEQLMADAVDADEALFSMCGSSLSVKSAMLAVAGPGERLLVSRNAHKSVVADQQFAYPPEPDNVREAFDRAPDAKGMLLITPTDHGTCADIAGTARLCHERGVPLIVDEAWGAAHLPFHPDLPAWAMDAGADLRGDLVDLPCSPRGRTCSTPPARAP